MLTPVDIHNKEFGRSFRGYNQEEIDDFLDQVVNDYELLYRENNQLKKEIELNEKQLNQYHQLEKNLQDTLLVAQRTADEVVNTANVRGDEVRQAAKQAADNLKREAEIYAENLRHETQLDCKRKVDAAAAQVRAAVAEYERIVREKREFIAKMRNLMQTELGILDEAYNFMPDKINPTLPKDVVVEQHIMGSGDAVEEAEQAEVQAEETLEQPAETESAAAQQPE